MLLKVISKYAKRMLVFCDIPERWRLTMQARRCARQWGTYPCPKHFRLIGQRA